MEQTRKVILCHRLKSFFNDDFKTVALVNEVNKGIKVALDTQLKITQYDGTLSKQLTDACATINCELLTYKDIVSYCDILVKLDNDVFKHIAVRYEEAIEYYNKLKK